MQDWDYIEDFHEGLAAVRRDSLWGFIDEEGNVIVEPKFDYVHDFSEGLALVSLPGDSNPHCYIDKSGKIVLKLTDASESFDFHEGVARAYDYLDLMGFVDKSGRWVIPPRRWSCHDFADDRAMVIVKGKYGFIDHDGRIVIPLKFNDADSFVDGVARVKIGKTTRHIDINGNFVKKPTKN